jgi:hypothetical protein
MSSESVDRPLFPFEAGSLLEDTRPDILREVELIYMDIVLEGHASAMTDAWERNDETAYVEAEMSCFASFSHPRLRELHSKAAFPEIIRGLGYLAPNTLVLRRGSDELEEQNQDETLEQIAALDPDNPTRFCKPLTGSRSIGTFRATGPAILERVRRREASYLVQQDLPGLDFRYALHQPVESLDGGGPLVRLAYKTILPRVTGDGETSLGDLLEARGLLPDMIDRIGRYEGAELGAIPLLGVLVEPTPPPGVPRESLNILPTEEELQTMDSAMIGLARRIKERAGVDFGVLCLDGATRPDGAIPLYENQFPFDPIGYQEAVAAAGIPGDGGIKQFMLSAWRTGAHLNQTVT